MAFCIIQCSEAEKQAARRFFNEESMVADLERITFAGLIQHHLMQLHYIQGDYYIAP